MDKPRVVIGVPCYREVAPEILEDWMRFLYHLGRRVTQFDFCLAIKTKSEQFRARNAVVTAAQQVNADWLLMLDDDMVINSLVTTGPSNAYDFLTTLIGHDKDVCGALYYQRGGHCEPVLMAQVPESKGYRFLRDDEITHGLQRVDVAGGGCLLIKMRVFDKLQAPYFAPEHDYGTDIQLCRQATAAGFEVWADTSIELGHLKNERAIVTSRNRSQFQAEDTLSGEIKQFIAADLYDRLAEDIFTWTGYTTREELALYGTTFLANHARWKAEGKPDAEWYRQFPKERVARQFWFNTENAQKRAMTTFLVGAVDHTRPLDVLDFGCGIGIPAFAFAEKGHRVTACDIAGTGTFEFLKWRAKQHGLYAQMTWHDSQGGIPHLGSAQFDVIVAMDCLEHIEDWRTALQTLASHLKPTGVLFTNNAILDDHAHPEHYPMNTKEFLAACVQFDLQPINTITYTKRPALAQAAA